MAKTDYQSIDEYLADQTPEARAALSEVRAAINTAVPDGEEVISYQVPAIKHHGIVFHFSAAKNHFSLLQPPPFVAFPEFADELERYGRSKSAVRFPYAEGVPADLIRRMAAFQAAWNEKNGAPTGRAKS